MYQKKILFVALLYHIISPCHQNPPLLPSPSTSAPPLLDYYLCSDGINSIPISLYLPPQRLEEETNFFKNYFFQDTKSYFEEDDDDIREYWLDNIKSNLFTRVDVSTDIIIARYITNLFSEFATKNIIYDRDEIGEMEDIIAKCGIHNADLNALYVSLTPYIIRRPLQKIR